MFISGMGGAAALSGAAAVQASPPGASNYDPKVGAALNFEAGYHFDDRFSAQAGYIWNRNRIIASEVSGALFTQRISTQSEHAFGGEFMVYFRPRSSWVRPYLSAGPAWVAPFTWVLPLTFASVGCIAFIAAEAIARAVAPKSS